MNKVIDNLGGGGIIDLESNTKEGGGYEKTEFENSTRLLVHGVRAGGCRVCGVRFQAGRNAVRRMDDDAGSHLRGNGAANPRLSFRPFRNRNARASRARARLGGMGTGCRALVFGRGGKEACLQHLRKRGFRADSRARTRLGRVGHRGGADV